MSVCVCERERERERGGGLLPYIIRDTDNQQNIAKLKRRKDEEAKAKQKKNKT